MTNLHKSSYVSISQINPEFLFNKKEYTQSNIEFIRGGDFERDIVDNPYDPATNYGDRIIENFIEDTYPGTTYDPEYHKKGEKDTDGLTLHTVSKYRRTKVSITDDFGKSLFRGMKVKNISYSMQL